MSALTLDAPIATNCKQLGFAWWESEQADCQAVKTKTPARKLDSRKSESPLRETAKTEAQPASKTHASTNNSNIPTSADTSEAISEDGILRFTDGEDGVRRIAQPVRMGTVMIKLLKRYGITDSEIAEGMENYARKTATSVAS